MGHQLHFTFCHKMPDRSFFWKGKQFPVCARCTGIYLGYFSFPLFLFRICWLNIWWVGILIIPTLMDGLTQAFLGRQSNNRLRLITGLSAGVGLMALMAVIGRGLGMAILRLISLLN